MEYSNTQSKPKYMEAKYGNNGQSYLNVGLSSDSLDPFVKKLKEYGKDIYAKTLGKSYLEEMTSFDYRGLPLKRREYETFLNELKKVENKAHALLAKATIL